MGENIKVDSVTKTPYAGMYEVRTNGDIFYTDETARYLFVGKVMDLTTLQDLTRARVDQISAIRFSDLPLGDAIKTVKGNGKRVMAVFEDPNCPYCRKLHQTLAGDRQRHDLHLPAQHPVRRFGGQVEGHLVRARPRAGMAALDGRIKAAPAAPADCSTPNEQVLALGRKLRVAGTPTIYFADGSRTGSRVRCGLAGGQAERRQIEIAGPTNMPPDASMRWALIQPLFSLSRLAIAPPMSSGRPTRPSAVCDATKPLSCALSRTAPPPKSVSIAPGAIDVDGDAARAQFLRHVLGQHLHRAFHRRIRGVARQREARQPGRHVDDAAAIGDQRQQLLRQEEHALEVNVEEHVELRLGGLGDRRMGADAGVIDEEVEALALPCGRQQLLQLLRERAERADVAGVEPQRRGARAARLDLGDDGMGGRLVAVIREDDVDALLRQFQCGALAEAAAAARDDCQFACHDLFPLVEFDGSSVLANRVETKMRFAITLFAEREQLRGWHESA